MASSLNVRAPHGLAPTLSGKFRRLTLFPSHTLSVKLRLAQFMHKRRTAKARKELEAAGFSRLLLPQSPDALPQDHADLMHLYHAVQRQKAQRVIEFGSGQSTIFIAQGLHDQGFGHLWSLDSNADWLKHTAGLIPTHLKPYITQVHSPVELTDDYGVRAWRYTVTPAGKWDFVLLDGPEGTGRQAGGSDMTTNLIELVDDLNPGATGFIDHRWQTTVLTREVLGHKLNIRYVPSLESFVIKKPA